MGLAWGRAARKDSDDNLNSLCDAPDNAGSKNQHQDNLQELRPKALFRLYDRVLEKLSEITDAERRNEAKKGELEP
jgi:hypothetical protein